MEGSSKAEGDLGFGKASDCRVGFGITDCEGFRVWVSLVLGP